MTAIRGVIRVKRDDIRLSGIMGIHGFKLADIQCPYICIWADGLIMGAYTEREMKIYLEDTNGLTIKRRIFKFDISSDLSESKIIELTDVGGI